MAGLFDQFPRLLEVLETREYDFEGCWTKTHPDEAYDTEDVAAALIVGNGILARGARLVGRPRSSFANFVQRNAQLSTLRDDILEEALDYVEEQQIAAAKGKPVMEKHEDGEIRPVLGDLAAGRFLLTTLGKHRGYSTRVEHSGGMSVKIGDEDAGL